jgi:hypothetical protein
MASTNQGVFLDTTEIIDTSFLGEEKYDSDDLRNIFIQVIQAFNQTSLAVNLKDTGVYSLAEFVNGQTFFPDPALSSLTAQAPTQRQGFRTTYIVGPLLNALPLVFPHGIDFTNTFTFTRIYAEATDTTGLIAIPIPFVSVSGTIAAGNIEIYIDATNVNITPAGNATNFNKVLVVLEYLKY